jgi:hypothetical protein
MSEGNRRDRDTYRYALRDGRDLVQFGVTEDPDSRSTSGTTTSPTSP